MTSSAASSQLARWSALVAGLWMLSSGGLSYNFAIYSSGLKEALQYGQAQVDLLGTAKDIGDNVGLLAGFLSALLPPWALLLLGALQNFVGYGMLYLVAAQHLPQPPFWQVFFWMWLGVNGSTYFNTAALVTCVRSFPKSRGVVVGLLKAMIGLSGAIYAQIYTALLAPNQVAFLQVLAVGPSLTALLVMAVLRPAPAPTPATAGGDPAEEHQEASSLRFLFVVFLSLAAYLMADILVSSLRPLSRGQSQAVAGGMLLLGGLTLLAPLRVYLWTLHRGHDRQPGQAPLEGPSTVGTGGEGERGVLDEAGERKAWSAAEPRRGDSWMHPPADELSLPMLAEEVPQEEPREGPQIDTSGPARVARYEAGVVGAASFSNLAALASSTAGPPVLTSAPGAASWGRPYTRPRRGEDFTLPEGLVKADFWLLFLSILCGAGSGLTAINNLAQLGQAQGFVDMRIPVALVSIWNYLGRVVGGFYSEHLVRHHGLPRPVILAGAQAIMVVGHLLFAFALPGSIYGGSLIVGSCFGTIMAMVPAIASELFGLQNFGLFYNVFTTASPIGSYVFSGLLAGYLYDIEAEKGDENPLSSTFLGLGASLGRGSEWQAAQVGEDSSSPRGPSLAGMARVGGSGEGSDGAHGGVARMVLGRYPGGGEELRGGSSQVQGWGWGWGWGWRGEPKPGGKVCRGAHCFRVTFILMAVVCLIGTLADVVLVLRTRAVYMRLYSDAPKRRSNEGKGDNDSEGS